MSADNYFVVRNHPNGGYAVVMAFASDDGDIPTVDPEAREFDTILAAVSWASQQDSEYGVSLHPELDFPHDLWRGVGGTDE